MNDPFLRPVIFRSTCDGCKRPVARDQLEPVGIRDLKYCPECRERLRVSSRGQEIPRSQRTLTGGAA